MNFVFILVFIFIVIDKEKYWVVGCCVNLVGYWVSVDISVGEKSGVYCEIRGYDCFVFKLGV